MVPRWRRFGKAVASGELSISTRREKSGEISPELKLRLENWRVRPNIITSSEVVETAIVEGHEKEGIRPARTLLDPNSGATPLLRKQADLLLFRAGEISAPIDDFEPTEAVLIAKARRRTRDFPRDAFSWTDLSLAHATSGDDYRATRCMSVALQLAPNDRHILRSAARLYLHLGDAERAHDLIRTNEATAGDPWLMAGEIAISALAERKPTFFKSGISLVESGRLHPKHVSELAGAIGTVHLRDGNRKARRLFITSLVDPNGNSLAQAEWASPHIGNLVEPRLLARVEDSSEARAFDAWWSGKFKEVVKTCYSWHLEEPISSRPHQIASGAAITIEQFDVALNFAEDGLKTNPNSTILHNNKAFALVSLGRFDEALRTLSHCLRKYPDDSAGPLTATAGLFAMRLGEFEEGKKRYREAMSSFRRKQNYLNEALACAYFAQEAARANLPDAFAIFQEATELCKKVRLLPEAEVVLSRANNWLKATAHRRLGAELRSNPQDS